MSLFYCCTVFLTYNIKINIKIMNYEYLNNKTIAAMLKLIVFTVIENKSICIP